MIISRTPFRISFFGGGTDYPVWFKENGGAVLATAIDKYCYISCRYLPPFFEHKTRVVYSHIENVKFNSDIEHPSVRETLKYMGIPDGVEIHHDGDLPARTGIGSSSSFTVGLLHSLFAMKRIMPTKMELAREAIHIERNILQESVGSQDQVCAAFGGFNKITFKSSDDIEVQPVILDRERLEEFQSHLVLCFTGFSRFASEVAGEQIRNTHRKGSELFTMQEMVEEALKILTSRRPLEEFGKLLHESWMLKRSLTDRITTSQIDEIYETARSSGAIGGKILGAGGGGFMLLFVKPQDQPKLRERLRNLLMVPFRFEPSGSQIIFYEAKALERDIHPSRIDAEIPRIKTSAVNYLPQ